MDHRRRPSYASASQASHPYQTFAVGYPGAAGYGAPVASSSPAGYPSGHYADYELQSPAADNGSAYYTTPRTAMNASQPPSMPPTSAPMGQYSPYATPSQPIPMGRPSYAQHPSASIAISGSYGQSFMPSSSPHSPGAGSPESPLSPLAHYAYSQSPPSDAAGPYAASQQRPYACDLCVLSFSRQHDLKRHRDTHSGEKPYNCDGGCGKHFTRKDALKRHQLVKRCGSQAHD